MKAHKTNVVKAAINALVSKERKFNNTNFGDWELSEEIDDADLVAISGGTLVSVSPTVQPTVSPTINVGSYDGSYDGGYNRTANNQTASSSVNNTNTSDTSTTHN